MGIVGRVIAEPEGGEGEDRRMKRVGHILKREGGDGGKWVERARGLKGRQVGGGNNHDDHG